MGFLLEVPDLLGGGGSKLGPHSGQGSVADSRVVSRGQQGVGLVLASRARQGGLAASRGAGASPTERWLAKRMANDSVRNRMIPSQLYRNHKNT